MNGTEGKRRLHVLLGPAEYSGGKLPRGQGTAGVVFDILRATTTMTVGLARGAAAIWPVCEIEEALELEKVLRKEGRERVLLAGERAGRRIGKEQAGGREFDLGNSPREFTAELVSGADIIMTTTNGTRAIQACATMSELWVGSFLNLQALAETIKGCSQREVVLVCAGTGEEVAVEDCLAAGALVERLAAVSGRFSLSDSAELVRLTYLAAREELAEAASRGGNGRRLLGMPDLREDVAVCFGREELETVGRRGVRGEIWNGGRGEKGSTGEMA